MQRTKSRRVLFGISISSYQDRSIILATEGVLTLQETFFPLYLKQSLKTVKLLNSLCFVFVLFTI